ncbi:MAG: ArsA family ATPase [Deltaproteobacteria bacterium]|nr:ArsA family ATPase [Deltaproteobacteria bacterium]
MNLRDLLQTQRIVVCVGSGGVGKTTIAAALALQGAIAGRRAMVLTIDPARRLAQSLGLDTLRPGGERISVEHLGGEGLCQGGTLSAGMLDQKSAWDEFIARHAPSAEVRDTLLANEFYQHLSRSFAGSTEYMAIEELCRIDESGAFDLIVLDTPPTGHALEFLEAPQRLEDFFDRATMAWLVRPTMSVGWSAWKTASKTVRFVFERIEDATGLQALAQIADFFVAIEHLIDGITERSHKVKSLLQGPGTAFVLVSGPDEQVLEDADELASKMRTLGMPLKGVVMNRVHAVPAGLDDDDATHAALGRIDAALQSAGIDGDARAWLVTTLEGVRVQAAAEAVRREAFEAALPAGVVVASVPEQGRDVHDLSALATLGGLLEGSDVAGTER